MSNLQQQLAELDEAAVAVEQTAAPADPAVASGTDCPPCELEVTVMDEKKLTVKISPVSWNRSMDLLVALTILHVLVGGTSLLRLGTSPLVKDGFHQ